MSTNQGWSVALAGTGINLALGILYTWSIFKGAIIESIKAGGPFAWDLPSVNDPYAVCLLSFAFSTIIAGRMQDLLSPRITALLGGLMVGAGFVLTSLTAGYWGWIAGFGVVAGAGIGFGYAAACPPALKWFGPGKSGLIAGIVVSGFGLAPVYIAPLAEVLLQTAGIQQAMLCFGIAFAVIVSAMAMMLRNPPAGYVPACGAAHAAAGMSEGMGPAEMLKTAKFYVLWACYFIGAGAGLMVIGFASGLAKSSLGSAAFVAVAIMALGNAGGRIAAGIMSDKLGRRRTLLTCLLFQAVLMFAGMWLTSVETPDAVLIVLLATFMGFNYGTNLSLFPAISKDLYGLRNFGVNYGFLFTAWGVGGFVLAKVSQSLVSETGSYQGSFMVAGILLVAGALLTFALRKGEVKAGSSRKPASPLDGLQSCDGV
jgi:nitrate/nitrite transporter NarK